VRINATSITLNYKRILYTEVTHTNYFASSLNIYISKTLVPDFGALFTHPSIDRKLYYNRYLSLNKNINLTSTSL